MTRCAKPGLWVLEARWSSSVRDVRTVTPVLRALEQAQAAKFAQHHINDRDDLVRELRRWGQAQHRGYGIGYVAMHGSPNSVHVGGKTIDLFDLAEEWPHGSLKSKVVHFGSCSVLTTPAARRTTASLLDDSGS